MTPIALYGEIRRLYGGHVAVDRVRDARVHPAARVRVVHISRLEIVVL